jgi:hypothetical protein
MYLPWTGGVPVMYLPYTRAGEAPDYEAAMPVLWRMQSRGGSAGDGAGAQRGPRGR